MKKITYCALFTILTLLAFSCKDTFAIPESADSSLNEILQSNRVRVKEKLDTPPQFFVSSGYYPTEIKIAWSEVKNAASYQLMRAVVDKSYLKKDAKGNYPEPTKVLDRDGEETGEWEIIVDPEDPKSTIKLDFNTINASGTSIVSSDYLTTNSYTDTILEIADYTAEEYNYLYYYMVCATNKNGGYEESDFTNPSMGYLLAPPLSITATTKYKDRIEIAWTKADGAVSYNIYYATRSDNSDAFFVKNVLGNQTSYSHKVDAAQQGSDFYFSVEAVNKKGKNSTKTAVALGYALKEGAPGAVESISVSGRGDTKDSISIAWEHVSDVDYYMIYRQSNLNSATTLIDPNFDAKSKTVGETLTYIDTFALQPNVYYYYRILGIKEKSPTEKIKGSLSATTATDKKSDGTSNAAEGFLLSAPSSISVEKESNGKYIFKIAQSIGEEGYLKDSALYTDYKSYKYKIKGSLTKDGAYSDVADVDYTVVYPENGYYTVDGIDGKGYKFFKVTTCYETGSIESNPSDAVAPSPDPARNPNASQGLYISGVTDPDYDYSYASHDSKRSANNRFNNNGIYPVKITWEAPVEGADGGYDIYRSSNPNSGFKKINEEPVKNLEYIDENEIAKACTFYYYRVLSLNELGQGSKFSNTVAGYGALTHNQYMREYNKTIQRSQAKLTLMHKPKDTDKLGTETISGDISGSLTYSSKIAGLGAEIKMPYTNYCDFKVENKLTGEYIRTFFVNGSTDTSANMSANGNMSGTMRATECMYPGVVVYDKVEIKGGNAGGGYYTITPQGSVPVKVDYTVGNEGWDR